MASYHCTVKAGASMSAAAHSAYVERKGKYLPRADGVRDDLEWTESGNLPAWAKGSSKIFWKASDEFERVNAAGYREYEVALPRELLPTQRLELVRDFVRQELGDRHAYTFAIHNPRASLEGGEQPHAHIMFSERLRDGIERDTPQHYFKQSSSKDPGRGGLKKANSARKTDAQRKAELVELRGRWATLQNKHLERIGAPDRVDHRSNEARGLPGAPEQHLGHNRVRSGSALARAVVQAREARLEVGVIDEKIGVQRRREKRIVLLQNKRQAKEQKQAEEKNQVKEPKRATGKLPPVPTPPSTNKPGPIAERDAWEWKAAYWVNQWNETVKAEKALYLKDITQKTVKSINTIAARLEEHKKAKPLIFGRKAWKEKGNLLDGQADHLSRAYELLKSGRYPPSEKMQQELQKECEVKAKEKNPDLEAVQGACRKILAVQAKRMQLERVAEYDARVAEAARQAPQRGLDQDRGMER